MKKSTAKFKRTILAILCPDQRRNWHKDQVSHYKKFLNDYTEIKKTCSATINGIKINDLLEKEIRNSYWIYRSSAIEQAVLISKIIARRVVEAASAIYAGEDKISEAVKSRSPKAIFIVSPATGVEAMLHVASSTFKAEDVAFLCQRKSPKIQNEILRRGFSVILAENPHASIWCPDENALRFLDEIWQGLKRIDSLNIFQKIFVYLYTRASLKSLQFYSQYFQRQLINSGCLIFTGRPRTPFVNGAIVAGRSTNNKVIFLSHTIWYKQPCPIGDLYDLSEFTGAALLTESCRREVQRVNKNIKISVIGMNKPRQNLKDMQNSHTRGKEKLKIGMFFGVNDFIHEVIPALSNLNVDIFLKTRPPGGNASYFSEVSDLYENVSICDHAHFSMDRFCKSIDVVVGGYSNAIFHAACRGVPVIGYLTQEEITYNSFLKPALIPFDLAVLKAHDVDELIEKISEVDSVKKELTALSKKQLENANKFIADVDYLEVSKII